MTGSRTGSARTYGAITVTNALPTGIGCAAGVELPVSATVTIAAGGTENQATLRIPEAVRSPLVEGSLQAGLSAFVPDRDASATLDLRSEVPVARGLKSSSAVSTAILLATARLARRPVDPVEIGRLSAEVGRRVGVSATGALDDALAGLGPGFVVTDNLHDELLRRTEIDPSWGVVLYIPLRPHPPSPELRDSFRTSRAQGEHAARAALDGNWPLAMRLNTELVERTMGYSYQPLRERLLREGAVACGVSGLGPTLAAIAPTGKLPQLLRELPQDDAERMLVPFVRVSPMEVPPA